MNHSSPKLPSDQSGRRSGRLFGDETHFLRTLFGNPRLTGAVAPSGRFLARAMARAVDPRGEGLVVELGPGTGPVTRALIERGVARERLVLVEYDGGFCRLLAQRFAPIEVVQGDAYDLPRTLAGLGGRPIAAVVSSLPLLNQPPAARAKLIEDAFALMGPEGIFVQFTYGLVSPIPRETCAKKFSAHRGAPIWCNLPPACVWIYRADPNAAFAEPMMARIRRHADRLMRRDRATAE
ncbi:MAG: rRNA adenine N-6-methyltransferase family protein [Roseiarcus sp.]|jgi:phosphatidylethanolamine/phosphatidyl-N-methylethanolamine N-methyltransferase